MPHFVLENWENCLGYLVGLCIKITEVLSIHSWVCLSYFSPVLVGTQLSFKWVAKTAFQAFFPEWGKTRSRNSGYVCLDLYWECCLEWVFGKLRPISKWWREDPGKRGHREGKVTKHFSLHQPSLTRSVLNNLWSRRLGGVLEGFPLAKEELG